MIKRFWYELLRVYVRLGLRFYFRKVSISGAENIPTDGPVMFLANHQNAFLDALVIVTTNKRTIHFLARAEVFANRLASFLLSTINLIPIYRIRDGWSTLEKNKKTFDQCQQIFDRKESVLMFPEGNHSQLRRIRPLSRGFTKIVLGNKGEFANANLQLVPVGINYEHHNRYFSRVHIIYGNPINVGHRANSSEEANRLRDEVSTELKKLSVHIDDLNAYQEYMNRLIAAGVDLCDPVQCNKFLRGGEADSTVKQAKEKSRFLVSTPLIGISRTLNLIPLLLWFQLKRAVKDPVMVSSIRFAYGIFAIPLIYFLETLLVTYLLGYWPGLVFLGLCIFSLPIFALIRD